MIIKKIEFSSINLIYFKENKILCIPLFSRYLQKIILLSLLNFIFMYLYIHDSLWVSMQLLIYYFYELYHFIMII